MSRLPSSGFDAIAIGASAGGVEALSELLPVLPADMQVAVFIVVHQSREAPSQLVNVLRARCRLAMMEAQDKQMVVPRTVYVAPPDYHLLIEKGLQLALSADEPVQLCRPSVDVLFESAAEAYGARLLGLILSGANEDGAQGLLAVSRAGGLPIVQDPKEARAPSMPRAALSAVPAATVLPLAQIAAALASLGERPGAR